MNAPVTSTQSVAGLYNANNQLTVAGMGYDAAGNLNQLSGYSALTYDGENRLTSAGRTGGVTMSYQYDGEGRRVAKSGGGSQTIFVYDAGGRMAAEYSTGAEMSTCATCYLSADHLGTPRLITDQNRMLVSRHDYLPFGEEIEAGQAGRTGPVGDGGDSINQKFTGKERDSESGLDYFGARYYGSALGRFASPDRKVITKQRLTDPQQWNGYSYTRNNPLEFFDPDGMELRLAPGANADAVVSALAHAYTKESFRTDFDRIASSKNIYYVGNADIPQPTSDGGMTTLVPGQNTLTAVDKNLPISKTNYTDTISLDNHWFFGVGITSDFQDYVAGHEFSHAVDIDNDAASAYAKHNNPSGRNAQENEADRAGQKVENQATSMNIVNATSAVQASLGLGLLFAPLSDPPPYRPLKVVQ